MGRFWSLLFLMVPVVGGGIFLWAAMGWWPMEGIWLPLNIGGADAISIDKLFYFILYLTGVIFIATGVALFWFLWKYDSAQNAEKPKFTHGSHTLEVVWSILPAATLLFIAVYQMQTWADAKIERPELVVAEPSNKEEVTAHEESGEQPVPPLAKVTGRQFEWRIQYAGKDGLIGTPDDLYAVNELHVPLNEMVVLQIETQDVLHSFFLPHLRVKQDVVPGMVQYVWFSANRPGPYDIVCAELCGWGHYKMRGRLVVESRKQYDRWYETAMDEQNRSVYEKPAEDEE